MSRDRYVPERFRPSKFGPRKRKPRNYDQPWPAPKNSPPAGTYNSQSVAVIGDGHAATSNGLEDEFDKTIERMFRESRQAFDSMQKRREEERAQAAKEIGVRPEDLELTADGFAIKIKTPSDPAVLATMAADLAEFRHRPIMGIPFRFSDMLSPEAADPREWFHEFAPGAQNFSDALTLAPFAALRGLVKRIKFGLSIGPTFGFEMEVQDRWWHDPMPTLDLVVRMKVKDRIYPHADSTVAASFPIPANIWRKWHTERDAAKWIRDQVASLLVHELDEAMTVNGDRMFDPHNPTKKIPGAL